VTDVIDLVRARADERPGHPALVVDGREGATVIRYAELAARMEARAVALRAAGLEPAERCGLRARQGPGFVEAALAILAAGGCFVPIPDDTAGPALERFQREAHLHALVEESQDFALRRLPPPAPLPGRAEAEFCELRPAYLRFTSGTTSRRKGVIVGHAAIRARLEHANAGLGIGPGDRVLWLLPMAHHFLVSILLYLRFGATILLPSSSLARAVLELANREEATVFYASPFHYALLGKDASRLELPRLRLAVSTAEGLRAEVAQRFAERFGIPLVQALGVIEVGLPVMNLASARDKPEALGRPLPGYEVWLRGEDGRPVEGAGSPERTGEICIRGPGLFDAYLEPWTPARLVLQPDGFRTGDQGFFDAEGDLFLAGRRTNRINMAGMKFFAEEVEAVLEQHPGVSRARVHSRMHPHLGEIPVAEVVAADRARPPERAALLAHCRAQLPTYKVPREIAFVTELPTTATGKLRRWDDEAAPRA
jgi:long-chain acyl-CoA synthetase